MKKIVYLLCIVIMAFTLIGCGSSAVEKKETTASKLLTIQDLAGKNNLSVGELNKIYRLDPKNKNSDGSNMIVNFQSIGAADKTIVIDNILQVDKTRELLNKAFFAVYDEAGKQYSDLSFKATALNNGDSGIIITSDKTDLTKCKYLSFGPVDGANGQQILFPIQ